VDTHPLDALDDSGDAVVAAQVGVRYKVWVVLGSERFELPTTYAGINEGQEKMARKVLRHLRSRDMGEVKQQLPSGNVLLGVLAVAGSYRFSLTSHLIRT
jgi:hypothetical protein